MSAMGFKYQDPEERAIDVLATDLFDAYITGDQDVIDEVDDWLRDYPWTERVRAAMVKECELPVMGRGGFMYKMGQAAISEACEAIAKRCTTLEDVESYRHDFNI